MYLIDLLLSPRFPSECCAINTPYRRQAEVNDQQDALLCYPPHHNVSPAKHEQKTNHPGYVLMPFHDAEVTATLTQGWESLLVYIWHSEHCNEGGPATTTSLAPCTMQYYAACYITYRLNPTSPYPVCTGQLTSTTPCTRTLALGVDKGTGKTHIAPR